MEKSWDKVCFKVSERLIIKHRKTIKNIIPCLTIDLLKDNFTNNPLKGISG